MGSRQGKCLMIAVAVVVILVIVVVVEVVVRVASYFLLIAIFNVFEISVELQNVIFY